MCGRFVITSPPEDLRRLLAYLEQPNFPPRYNIAPASRSPRSSATGAAPFSAWLDCGVDAKQAAALVGKAPDDFLEAVEVSPLVNSVKNDSEENILPNEPPVRALFPD